MKRNVFFFLSILFVLFSLTPTWYELTQKNNLPSVRYFELVHNFPTDYNFYLSRIREGIEGRITVLEKYTSEPHQGSFIHIFYVSLGWLGRWVRVPWERAGDVYHAARIVFAVALLSIIAYFARKSFALFRWQLVAFLLAVTASTWPKLVFYGGGWRFGGYMPWWSVMDSLQRITFIPHLIVGQALMLFLIIALADDHVLQKPGNWIFLGLITFLLGVIFPPGLVFVYAVVFFLILLNTIPYLLQRKSHRISYVMHKSIPRGIVCLLGFPSFLYLNLMLTFYPWKRLAEFDIVKPLPFDYLEYIKAVGPVLPLGLLGLGIVLLRKDKSQNTSIAWVLAWVSLLLVFHFIPSQSPLRFSEMIPHVPLAMLTAYVFFIFAHWLTGIITKQKGRSSAITRQKGDIVVFSQADIARVTPFVIPGFLIIVGLGVMYSSWLWQRDFVDHKVMAAYPLVPTGSYVMYPLKDFIAAMKFIQDNTTRDTVILTETTAGNYMPVYSGNSVFIGHANTVNSEVKEAIVKAFYSEQMRPDDARSWLTAERLHYIFFGPQEQEDGGVTDLQLYYPFLQPIFKNTYVIIYQY
jgi:hypothetical protein